MGQTPYYRNGSCRALWAQNDQIKFNYPPCNFTVDYRLQGGKLKSTNPAIGNCKWKLLILLIQISKMTYFLLVKMNHL